MCRYHKRNAMKKQTETISDFSLLFYRVIGRKSFKPLLYKEVDNIIREGVTEEELSKVVKNTLKEAEQSKQHNAYWLTTLVTYYKTGVNLNDPKNMETLVASIQPKDVQKFAKKFFKDADVIDLIFSPQQK
jgi:zinc protease